MLCLLVIFICVCMLMDIMFLKNESDAGIGTLTNPKLKVEGLWTGPARVDHRGGAVHIGGLWDLPQGHK